jgi:cytochrome b561
MAQSRDRAIASKPANNPRTARCPPLPLNRGMSTDLAHELSARRSAGRRGFAPSNRSEADAGDRAASPTIDRYDRIARTLHWVIGLALLGQIAFGFLMPEIAPRGTPARAEVVNLHKSIGIVLGAAIVLRVAWRIAHRPPPWPSTMPGWQRRAAEGWHRALYACMVLMPLTGYVASNLSRRGVRFFGVALAPWGPDLPTVYSALQRVHDALGFVLAALVAGHVVAALKHAVVDRDGVFARMGPGGRR